MLSKQAKDQNHSVGAKFSPLRENAPTAGANCDFQALKKSAKMAAKKANEDVDSCIQGKLVDRLF